jgi:lysophospholipase L1-like esterase
MRMVVIGDSVLWGQGLTPDEKIGHLTHKMLADAGWQFDFDEEADFLAHSGAIIGQVGASGQEVNPQIEASVQGEVPTAHPTIYEQLSRIESPRQVDLLLMDGGANDFGFLNLAKPRSDFGGLEQEIRGSLNAAHVAIRRARQTCPNAVILYSGYYAGISSDTSSRALNVVGTLGAMLSPAGFLANLAFGSLKDRIILANHFWHHVQLLTLRTAVAQAAADPDLRGPGIAFVHPRFGIHNALGAGGPSYVRGVVHDLNPDPRLVERRGACAIQHDPSTALMQAVTQAQNELRNVDTDPTLWTISLLTQVGGLLGGAGKDFFSCANAATFHPMPAGAQSYAEAATAAFERVNRVSVREFATALAPKTRSVRTAIKRWGLDGPRAPSLHTPTSLSLRELSQHREIDFLLVTIGTGGLRQGTNPLPASNPWTERFASIFFGTGARAFHLDARGERHLPSSGGLLQFGNKARFVVDPSFAVERNRGEGTPMRLEQIQMLRVQAPQLSNFPSTINWAFAGIQVLLNGSIVVYDTTDDPSVGESLNRNNLQWISGEAGTPRYPLPE